MSSPKHKPLVIRDEIHGDMSFDYSLRHVIDHENFQRLRYIKQLGLAEFVFPCANHTRFQHSLGASYLAGQYFHSLLKGWLSLPFRFEVEAEGTRLFVAETYDCVREVAEHPPSKEFWWQVVSMAGMLHDVGHGPWSHSFEQLHLEQDFRALTKRTTGIVREYFQALEAKKERFWHEDLSVLYIFHMLDDLEERGVLPGARAFFLPVATLVNKGVGAGERKKRFEAELASGLKKAGIRGGAGFQKLLRPVISGPFDVDRMDYIQRDGRNCGVSIGGIEWRRIVNKVIPCLAEHTGANGEREEVCLISNVKNQHVLDDFIFSLFQMYAQVYMHPKIVGLEEIIKQKLGNRVRSKTEPVITFELHRSLSDERFRELLKREFNVGGIDDVLLRRPGNDFKVASYPTDAVVEKELKKRGFTLLDTQDRPMMKDALGVFLFSAFRTAGSSEASSVFLKPWASLSPVARYFDSIKYSPHVWIQQ